MTSDNFLQGKFRSNLNFHGPETMEIEVKFIIKDRETYNHFKNLDSLYGYQLTEGDTQAFRDTYLDTDTRQLYTQGFVLRQREANDRAWITLKSLQKSSKGSIHQREEFETPLPPGTGIEDWPQGPVRDKVQQIIGGSALAPLVAFNQTRVTRQLLDGSRKVADLCLDEVSIKLENGRESYLELEIELQIGGTHEELKEIAQRLGNEWNLTPQKKSKFSRALAQTSLDDQRPKLIYNKTPTVTEKPGKAPGINREDSMIYAARKTLVLHFRRMLYHEPGTRAGRDIEELHDMRVAVRRQRAALRVFNKFIASDEIKPIRKGLKLTGRRLGAVRDLDVFWEKTAKYLESRPSGEAADLDSLHRVWDAERRNARKKMLTYLDSKDYRKFVINFHKYLEDDAGWEPPAPRKNSEPVPHHLQLVVPVVVYQRLAEMLAYDEWITQPDAPLAQYHRLRIAVKRLRYTLEFFEEVLGSEVDMLIERLKAVQDHLGDLQDCVVARDILTGFLKWGAWNPQIRGESDLPKQPRLLQDPDVRAYLKHRDREQQILADSFPHIWRDITDPYFSHSIAAMLTAW